MRASVRFITLLALFCFFATDSFAQNTAAVRLAAQQNWSAAKAAARKETDPVVRDLYRWFAYTKNAPDNDFKSIERFVKQNADWPFIDKIRVHAENIMPLSLSDGEVINWFRNNTPVTVNGVDRYARALMASGRTTALRRMLNDWWPDAHLTRAQQKEFYAKYNRYMSRATHLRRMNHLLHAGKYSNAQGMAAALGKGYPALAQARKALAQQSSNASQLVRQVPAVLQSDAGLMYERLRWRRRNNLNDGAIEMLMQSPSASAMHEPKLWWRERHIIARRLIEARQYQKAYGLVKRHKQVEGFPMAQAEWLSGWLALRFVGQPWEAFEHFEKLYKNVKSPISRARGAYWAGRASDALKHPKIASEWYQVAMQYPHTFYGQLAMSQMGRLMPIKASALPTVKRSIRTQFLNKKLVRAVHILYGLGLKKETDLFMSRLLKDAKTTSDYILIAELAKKIKQTHMSIRAAQALEKKGVRIDTLLYPTLQISAASSKRVENGFIHAIVRQESRFDSKAVSHAGARGYMQLMPATAKQVARQSGISHQKSWLTTRPEHNISLGSRYLKQMRDRYQGNYAMAAAAYNAGPGRVDRWLNEFGDPRRNEVDLIDWVELIPIYETRNYVQRVLEGVFVYRSLLDEMPRQVVPIHTAYRHDPK